MRRVFCDAFREFFSWENEPLVTFLIIFLTFGIIVGIITVASYIF